MSGITSKGVVAESLIQRDYFKQFRDSLFVIEEEGNILYKSPLLNKMVPKLGDNIVNIHNIFPNFSINLNNFKVSASKDKFFMLHNQELKLWGEAISIDFLQHPKPLYLVSLHNPLATSFVLDLLSDEPQEYLRYFFKENIKQYIFYSNEVKNFIDLLKYTLQKADYEDSVLANAIRYINQQTEFYRSIYLQQNNVIQNKQLDYNSLKEAHFIILEELLEEFKIFASGVDIKIVADPVLLKKNIKGERNWITYAFKNIASLVTSEFPEINPIVIDCGEKLDRNQLLISIDFSNILTANKAKLSYDAADDQSVLYHCLKVMEMNRGNMKYSAVDQKLLLTLPLQNRDSFVEDMIVLVADADWNARQRIISAFKKTNHKIRLFESTDPASTLKTCAEIEPDFIILDPYFFNDDNNIYDLIDALYAVQMDPRPHLVIFSNYSKIAHQLISIFSSYSFDYLRKEVTEEELLIFLSQSIANSSNFKMLNDLAQNVRRVSEVDSMTGAFNRSFYDELIKRELEKAKKNNTTVGLIATDIDNFKSYNDNNGHLAGDRLLRQFVEIIKNKVRASDYVARYGGEEFVIVLVNASPNSVYNIADKICKEIDAFKFPHEKKQPNGSLTASFGVSCYPIDGKEVDDLFKAADKRLYEAKRNGRNRVVGW